MHHIIEAVSELIGKQQAEAEIIKHRYNARRIPLHKKLKPYKNIYEAPPELREEWEASLEAEKQDLEKLYRSFNKKIVRGLSGVGGTLDGIFANHDRTELFPISADEEARCLKLLAREGYMLNEHILQTVNNRDTEKTMYAWNPNIPHMSDKFYGKVTGSVRTPRGWSSVYETWHWAPYKFHHEDQEAVRELIKFGWLLGAVHSNDEHGFAAAWHPGHVEFVSERADNLVAFVEKFTTGMAVESAKYFIQRRSTPSAGRRY